MEEQMNVRVDQAGHERRVPEVNHLRIGRMRHGLPHCGNFVAADQHFATADNPPDNPP